MTRLLATMKLDITIQIRNQLYAIGIGVAVVLAIALSQLTTPDQLPLVIPTVMLLVMGGSTLLYVSSLILFEKDEGTINMAIVSPLTSAEYLVSKIVTLTGLATLESIIMIAGTMILMSFSAEVVVPNLFVLFVGIIAIGVLYTLIGILLIVRYDKITEFLIPMSAIAVVLQFGFLYYLGLWESPLLLLIPTSAPTMIMRGAYVELSVWEWLYGIIYTSLLLVGLSFWSYRAFQTHIVMKVG
jgi:fluoroquinolone transport system permease protein